METEPQNVLCESVEDAGPAANCRSAVLTHRLIVRGQSQFRGFADRNKNKFRVKFRHRDAYLEQQELCGDRTTKQTGCCITQSLPQRDSWVSLGCTVSNRLPEATGVQRCNRGREKGLLGSISFLPVPPPKTPFPSF